LPLARISDAFLDTSLPKRRIHTKFMYYMAEYYVVVIYLKMILLNKCHASLAKMRRCLAKNEGVDKEEIGGFCRGIMASRGLKREIYGA
ncbi:MAG: hypothetical protein LUC23_04785, partial [Prevotellaceae bacterium]|nr:hypothetical protein [Prevotellaceae bacterium]